MNPNSALASCPALTGFLSYSVSIQVPSCLRVTLARIVRFSCRSLSLYGSLPLRNG